MPNNSPHALAETTSLVVVEPVCADSEHAPFNIGIVEAAAELGHVVFIAARRHIEAVERGISPEARRQVDFQPTDIAPRRLRNFHRRLPLEWAVLNTALRTARRQDAAAVLFTGITEPALFALKMHPAVRMSRRRFGVVFHSIIDQFLYSAKQRALLAAMTPANVKYLLLGEHVRRYVISKAPSVTNTLAVIPHPAPRWTVTGAASLNPEDIRFGFAGFGSVAKGFAEFLRLADDVTGSPDSRPENVRFEFIGRCSSDCRLLFDDVQSRCGERFVVAGDSRATWPRALYERRFATLSYAVMPYHADHYSYTVSGSVLDAVAAAKPMIALESPAAREIFNRLGDVGYLCSTYAALLHTIREIALFPPVERYKQQCERIVLGRSFYERDSIAAHLAAALNLASPLQRPAVVTPGP